METLLEAIKHDNLPKVKSLLKNGVDLSKPIVVGEEYDLEDYDETPLLFYVINNQVSLEVIELLLEYGIDISQRDDSGLSALDVAIKSKRYDVIELCLDRGFDINSSGRKSGITPLMLASCFSDIELAKLLLDRGADINATDRYGMSPKDYARKLGQNRMEEFLADRGGLFSAYKEELS